MNRVHFPPDYVRDSAPLVFLAGPIQGAPDWQCKAVNILTSGSIRKRIRIACPRRPEDGRGDFSPEKYNEQVDWEHYHLYRAGLHGTVMFWLAKELVHDCSRAYAQTTRFELGEAVALHATRGISVVVGIEEGFSNARYIRRTLAAKAPRIPVLPTLESTCTAAIDALASRIVSHRR